MSSQQTYAKIIKHKAQELGFDFCGITKAEFLEEDAPRLETWLANDYHGEMNYMEGHFDKRLDPSKLVPGAKSVVSLMYNYFPTQQQNESSYKVSKYAYGKDYHHIIKSKLKGFVEQLQEDIGDFSARVFVDSAPLLERSLAQRAGLGWIGKNSMLIHPKNGSFYFLAEIVLDLELEYDGPIKDYCGTCTACIEACPTDAILDNNVVDGSKCISYFTIELKNEVIPNEVKDKFEDWMFGCDICQDVCPWNRFSTPHKEPLFEPHSDLLKYTKREWKELTEEIYQEIFRKSAVKRTKYAGLVRNINFLAP